MRKILTLLLLLFTISLTSCKKEEETKLPIVVATIFPQYDIVRCLAGEFVELHMAVLPGVDTHNYDPSVSDMILVKNSALFIYTGDFMENWAKTIGAENSLDLSKISGMTLSNIEEKHEEHDHDHGIDPHIWTGPSNLKLMVQAISIKLQEILPNRTEYIKAKEIAYIASIDKIINEMSKIKEQSANTTFYFGTPFAMHYLFEEFGLKYESVYVTCSVEVDPSIDEIINMTNIIKSQNVPVLFVKELTKTSVAESIISGTNCKLVELHSGHNVSKIDFETGVTLLGLMQKNIEALKRAIV